MTAISNELLGMGIVVNAQPGKEEVAALISKRALQQLSPTRLEIARTLMTEYIAHNKVVQNTISSGKVTYYGNREDLEKALLNVENLVLESDKIKIENLKINKSRKNKEKEIEL